MLYKRGKNWWVRFTVGGREVRRSTGTADRSLAEEAERAFRETEWRQSRLGQRVYTWGDAAESWRASTPHKRSQDKDAIVLAWWHLHLAGKPLTQITAALIADLRATRAEESSPSTANRYLATLRAVLRHAEQQGMMEKAPRVSLYAIEQAEPRWITRDQFEALCSRLRPLQADIARFAVCTGLRRTNITHLRWSQVDMERRSLVIPGRQAKAKKPIPVPLNAEAMEVLKRRQGTHPEWVFARKSAKKPLLQTTTARWREACREAGVEGLRFHDLRHTWASWHIQNGTPLHILQELGGWASYAMVKRYAHLTAAHLAPYAEAVSRTNLGTGGMEAGD